MYRQIIFSLRRFLKCVKEESIETAMNAAGAWEKIKKDDYYVAVTVIAKYVYLNTVLGLVFVLVPVRVVDVVGEVRLIIVYLWLHNE